jgi:hypothetical protein
MEVVIDGVTYAPVEDQASNSNIGVAISTQNRREVYLHSLEQIKKFLPKGAKLVIVDDASKIPAPEATFRFDSVQGIAKTKNKCLELLDGCEHVFLFDDDTFPTEEGWEIPYINSPEPHLMYTFCANGFSAEQYRDDQHVGYNTPCGCMLYLHRSAIDRVGGFDPVFGRWGGEHGDLSSRIHNAGLTSMRYMDVADPKLYCMDQKKGHQRTVPTQEIIRLNGINGKIARERYEDGDSRYIEYRTPRNVVMSCYLTTHADPQRGQRWKADSSIIMDWAKSIRGADIVLFEDQLDESPLDNLEFVKVAPNSMNVYFRRWLLAYEYLRNHKEIEWVFLTDATDVVMQVEPWEHLSNDRLYVGYETKTVNDPWLIKHHPDEVIQTFIKVNPTATLLNAGVVGGDRKTVMDFCHSMIKEFFKNPEQAGVGDMGWFNIVARDFNLVYGPGITTVFMAEETNNFSWFKHK